MFLILLTLASADAAPSNGPGLSIDEVVTLVQRDVPDRIVAATLHHGQVRRCFTWVDLARLASEDIGPRGGRAAREHQCVDTFAAPPTDAALPLDRRTKRERRKQLRSERRAQR